MHRIEAELLIPGRGEPVRDGVVVLDGPRIGYAGPAGTAPPTPGAPVSRAVAVMPGMWDCHGHFLGTRSFDLRQLPLEPAPLRGARSARDLRAALDAGITSVREVGGLGVYLARAVAEGVLDGPAIYAAGAILSTTGGHADLHSFPLDWMVSWASETGTMRLADGPDECVRAVREQLRRNAKVIKVCASGGVLSEIDDPIHQQFTAAELRAIVEVAGLADRVVAAHCHGKPGIMAALRAGVRTIEHGTYLDDECCDAMRESGAILVPTRTIIENILGNSGRRAGLRAGQARGARRPPCAGRRPRPRARGHHRHGHRHRPDRPGPAEFVGAERSRARVPGEAGHDSAGGDRGGYRHRAAHPRAAGPAQRAARRRLRRRRDHPGRRPAGRHRRARRPAPHHRGLDRGPAGRPGVRRCG